MAFYNLHRGEKDLNKNLMRKWKVSRQMVARYISSGNSGRVRWGKRTLFSPRLEKEIKDAIFLMHETHFGLTRGLLMKLVGHLASKLGKSTPTESWLRSFLKRHPDIASMKASGKATCRYDALNPARLTRFYENMALATTGVPPSRIFVMDETGVEFPDGYRVGNIFGLKMPRYA